MDRSAGQDGTSVQRKLERAIEGEVLFDAFSRGRYATDASIYQMMPLGVVIPKSMADVRAAMEIAREEGIPILPRGGGTSQCGQTVNEALVIDASRYLDKLIHVDAEAQIAEVEPGLVLDHLNNALKKHGLWYPVDVSTGSRATLGGMTANNSCGARSIRYGTSRDNVIAIDAILADGANARFANVPADLHGLNEPQENLELFRDLLALGSRESEEIRARFPDMIRRVGGYNLDALLPNGPANNLAHLLVGSEGTLAFSEKITLKLSPILRNKVLGLCHFPTFYDAMDATQHLVKLGPTAVELVDRNMIELGRAIPIFRPVIDACVRGDPDALLIVEFAEEDMDENLRRLKALSGVMAELGFLWGDADKKNGGVVEAVDPAFQAQIIEFRKQGLNVMMSMKSEGKPVSFVEDCAVQLPDLAEYTSKLTDIFRKYGTDGTWYAHASVGTLHVRPVLNLKLDTDLKAMRAIAEEAFELVRSYKGSHSGEHGDGIVRSEFHETMFGSEVIEMFNWVKDRFDPNGLFNPGKIVRPPKMNDRKLLRYGRDYAVPELETVFDWSGHYGSGRGLQGAVEMCNNNGACRKMMAGAMCPSYRVTRNERDVTRGRANTLRLAMSGQLGPDAMTSDSMADTLSLCVSCKACRRECPTGVDMAKMKIEVLAARRKVKPLSARERLIAYMPHYAPLAAKAPWLANLRDSLPGAAKASELLLGLAAERRLPKWRSDIFVSNPSLDDEPEVLLFADTFNRYFEPENLHAAERVLQATGAAIGHANPKDANRPLCCGRTFLSAGLAAQAEKEMRRAVEAFRPVIEKGGVVVGLEPSCLFTFRDEAPALLGRDWTEDFGKRVLLFEEYLAEGHDAETLELPVGPLKSSKALIHGHCHQKSFGALGATEKILGLIPELDVSTIESSCCGMAGAFGYQAETFETSAAMGELSLLPKVREAGTDSIIVADGTSCRHQISDLADRGALHAARVLDMALKNA